MAKTGLLILTKPNTINHILPIINKHVKKTLYVQLSQQHNLVPPWIAQKGAPLKPPQFRELIVGIYTKALSLCQNLDVRILMSSIKYPYQKSIETRQKVDVVIFDQNYSNDNVHNFMQSYVSNKNASCEVVTINVPVQNIKNENVLDNDLNLLEFPQDLKLDSKMYNNVVLGGTFDRLHSGHKILLSEALLHCAKRLTVGVTDVNMLKSKKLWELIEPCEKRIGDVHDFLSDVDCGLQYNIVPIDDPFGPTKEDPDLQMIVVSSETFKGGQKVNELRKEKGLSTLEVLNIEILEEAESNEHDIEEAKVSSSNYRIRLLGQRLREPEVKLHIPQHPYTIGLTGCIASGKSSVSKRLEGLGAGVVNCDALAHKLYKKGEPCYYSLVEHFGRQILDSQEEVDRKVLGSIVFSNKDQLEKLNSLLWPAILQLAKDEAQNLYKMGHNIVVLDAAVLLQAGWEKDCHETWVCIIPPEEAVKRIQDRNKLSLEDAQSRISAQPTNLHMVSHADVVLCTLWEPQFTQKQVEKAWNNLQEFLKVRGKL